MTLTAEILDAIKSAPDTVEWRIREGFDWNSLKDDRFTSAVKVVFDYEWRIKPKPYEERHVIYLNRIPAPFYKGTLSEYLFGDAAWCDVEYKHFSKKFEIIIREIVE